MALRLILVSLVASMGFELPSTQEVESWNRSGHAWIAARVGELSTMVSWSDPVEVDETSSMLVEGEEVAARPEPSIASPSDDLSFEVVVEGMASSFAEDVASARIVADVDPVAIAEVTSTKSTATETDGAPDPIVEAGTQSVRSSARISRLTEAVRLTRRAVEAWAHLIDAHETAHAVDEVVLSR